MTDHERIAKITKRVSYRQKSYQALSERDKQTTEDILYLLDYIKRKMSLE